MIEAAEHLTDGQDAEIDKMFDDAYHDAGAAGYSDGFNGQPKQANYGETRENLPLQKVYNRGYIDGKLDGLRARLGYGWDTDD